MSMDDNGDNFVTRITKIGQSKGKEILSKPNINRTTVESYGRIGRNQLRRMSSDLNFTDILTKFPTITVVLCLIVTGFFSWESGLVDCRDDFCPIEGKSSMNVNGDLGGDLVVQNGVVGSLERVTFKEEARFFIGD